MFTKSPHKGPFQFQLDATATGSGNELDITDIHTGPGVFLGVQVEGLTDGEVTLEASITGTWVTLECEDVGDTATKLATIAANGIYRATIAGVKKVRANLSTLTTGTVTVTGIVVY